MAKVKGNILLDGLSGKLGESLVFRQVGGKTILAKAPDMSHRELSPAQRKHLNKFQRAKEYACKLKDKLELKAVYQTRACGNKAAYHVAIGDYMNSPKIEHIDASSYHGRMGDVIKIRATDDFQVTRIQMCILDPNGSLIEAGEAIQQANMIDWIYTDTGASACVNGSPVKATAMDRPDNVAEAELVIS